MADELDLKISDMSVGTVNTGSELFESSIPSGNTYYTGKVTSAQLGNFIVSAQVFVGLNGKTVIQAISDATGKALTGTLEAGETTITFTDASITANSTFDYFTSVYGVSPTDVTSDTGEITLTFEEQEDDIEVKVVIT